MTPPPKTPTLPDQIAGDRSEAITRKIDEPPGEGWTLDREWDADPNRLLGSEPFMLQRWTRPIALAASASPAPVVGVEAAYIEGYADGHCEALNNWWPDDKTRPQPCAEERKLCWEHSDARRVLALLSGEEGKDSSRSQPGCRVTGGEVLRSHDQPHSGGGLS